MKFSQQFIDKVASSKFVSNLKAGKISMDNSEFSYWNGCFASGLYYGALRRVPARGRSALAYGSAVHVGIENFLRGDPQWMALALAEAATNGLDSLYDPKRNSDALESLLTTYCLEYSRKTSMQFHILESAGKPLVETGFRVPLGTVEGTPFGNVEIEWTGKIDALTLYDGKLCPVDHKTTSVMGDKFIDDKLRSSQMLGYTYAARYLSERSFDNLPVYGVRINALATRSGGYEFKIFDVPIASWKVDEWKAGVLLGMSQYISSLCTFLRTGEVSPTRDHCVTKYGRCAYFDACECMPAMRDRMVFDDEIFAVSNWSPLAE